MSEDPRRKGLGRGLSALLEEDSGDYQKIDRMRGQRDVPIELLAPNPYQPRRHFDEAQLADLVNSIREKGILQPILVRRSASDPNNYEIIAGERRWRAAQMARLHQVPVLVKELTDVEALEVAIIENVQRQDLTPVEEAEGLQRLVDEFGHTQERLAEIVGKSRSHIANTLRLLTLPEPVRRMLQDGSLTAGHARSLVTVPDPLALAKQIVARGLNVRQTEKLAREAGEQPERGGGRGRAPARPAQKDADTLALERELSEKLGLKVDIEHVGERGGRVNIVYRTLDQLDEICRRLTNQATF